MGHFDLTAQGTRRSGHRGIRDVAREAGVSIATVSRAFNKPETEHCSVGYDNFSGAARATDYLLDLGHRDIGVMDDPIDRNDRAALRAAGVVEALKARIETGPFIRGTTGPAPVRP